MPESERVIVKKTTRRPQESSAPEMCYLPLLALLLASLLLTSDGADTSHGTGSTSNPYWEPSVALTPVPLPAGEDIVYSGLPAREDDPEHPPVEIIAASLEADPASRPANGIGPIPIIEILRQVGPLPTPMYLPAFPDRPDHRGRTIVVEIGKDGCGPESRRSTTTSTTAAPVPEPGIATLTLLGTALFAMRRRRSKP